MGLKLIQSRAKASRRSGVRMVFMQTHTAAAAAISVAGSVGQNALGITLEAPDTNGLAWTMVDIRR